MPLLMAAAPVVRAYPETVRFDLDSGALLMARRGGAPKDASALELRLPLKLHAVRDEVVAFQLVVEGEDETLPISLTEADGIRGSLFREVGVRIDIPSNSANVQSLGPGLYPDPLIPSSTVAPVNGRAVVWVDLHVDRTAAQGKRAFEVRIGDTRVPVELDVLDVTLPTKDAARLGAVNFGSFLVRGRRDRRHELAWMQMAHAHYLSVELMRPTPDRLPNGRIHWEGWAEHVGPYVDGSAFTAHYGYRGPRAGQPATRFILPHTDWWPVDKNDRDLPSDPAAFSRALAEWEQFAESRGWFDQENATDWILFVNSLDEPKRPEQIESLLAYEKLIAAAGLKNRRRVHFRVDGNFGQSIEGWSDVRMAEELGPVVDIWNVHGAPYTIPWALLQRRRKMHDEEITVYFSNTSGEPAIPPTVIDAPLAGLRAWGWLVMRYELSGALNWEVDYEAGCVENPLCSPGGRMNLDATLIYRGGELGEIADRPIPSMRLKALRRGAQDAALLSLLKAKDPETARQIAHVMVPRALGDEVPNEGYGVWPQDPMTYERARYALLDRLAGVPEPLPLGKIRFDKPAQFLGKSSEILLRVLIFLAVIVSWVLVMRWRRNRIG